MTSEQLGLVRTSSPVQKAVTEFKWPGRLHTLVSPYVHVLTNEGSTKLTTKLHIIKVLSSIQILITNKTTHLEECLHKHIFLDSNKRNLQTELSEQSLQSSLQINWYHKTIANRHNIWNQREKLNFKVQSQLSGNPPTKLLSSSCEWECFPPRLSNSQQL